MTLSIKRRVVHDKNGFSRTRIYPCNHEVALRILTRRKTLNENDITALQSLGVEIRDVDEEIFNLIKGKDK